LSKSIFKKFKVSAILVLLLISVFGFLATKSETVKAANTSVVGNTTVGTNNAESTSISVFGSRFEALTKLTVAYIFAYVAAVSSIGGVVYAGIYSDNNGEPGTLVGASEAVSVTDTPTWVKFPVSVQFDEDDYYWLCLIALSAMHYYYNAVTINQFAYSTFSPTSSSSPVPTSFTSPAWDRSMSIYASASSSPIPEFSTSALISVASAMAVVTLCAVALAARKPKRTSFALT